MAESYQNAGRHAEAAKAFDTAIQEAPNDPHIFMSAARAYMLADDPRNAAKKWQLLKHRFPKSYDIKEQLSYAKALKRSGDLDEAWTLYEHIHTKRPDMHWGIRGMASVAEASRQPERALSLWQRCFDEYPSQVKQSWRRAQQRIEERLAGNLLPGRVGRETANSEPARNYAQLTHKARQPGQVEIKPLRYQSVLIVTYGRSGSTLLQGILNSIDGMLVRGENGNFFFDLFTAFDKLSRNSQKYDKSDTPNSPWFGVGQVPMDRVMANIQEIAQSTILADSIDDLSIQTIGFKEVRYDGLGEQLGPYLDFLSSVFPNPAFIFLTRDLDQVVKSAWWNDVDPNEVRAALTETEADFSKFAASRHNCLHLTYRDMMERTDQFKAMFEFLGAPYRSDILDVVMATPHSYAPSQDHVRKIFTDF